MNSGPVTDAGKSLIPAAPARQPARASVGVIAPGNAGTPRVGRPGDECRIGHRHDEERRPGGQRGLGVLDPEDGAGADGQPPATEPVGEGADRVDVRRASRR